MQILKNEPVTKIYEYKHGTINAVPHKVAPFRPDLTGLPQYIDLIGHLTNIRFDIRIIIDKVSSDNYKIAIDFGHWLTINTECNVKNGIEAKKDMPDDLLDRAVEIMVEDENYNEEALKDLFIFIRDTVIQVDVQKLIIDTHKQKNSQPN